MFLREMYRSLYGWKKELLIFFLNDLIKFDM